MSEKRARSKRKAAVAAVPVASSPAEQIRDAVRKILPAAFREGEVQAERVLQVLGAEQNPDRYRFEWAGKNKALHLAAAPPAGTLAPDTRRSRDFFATRNVYIEAENLEALKIISDAYAERVKMIYIDPPYNTGNDFVYNDKFAVGSREYMAAAGMLDKNGKASRAARAEVRNLNGHKHSAWLSMMWPRLMLAHGTLAQNGVIFISIDDNEVHHLRLVMNEIFGEENFVALLPTVMNLKGNQDQFAFAGTHEYTMVFAKSQDNLALGQFEVDDEAFAEWEQDEGGFYRRGANLKGTGVNAPREKRPHLHFPLYVRKVSGRLVVGTERRGKSDVEIFPTTDGREMSWRWQRKKFEREPHNVIVERVNGSGYAIYKKQRPEAGDLPSKKPKTLFYKPQYSSGNGTQQLRELFGVERIHDNPKPLDLIKDFVRIGMGKDDIVMDFFSGSATTAHAVMALNAEDGGKRRCVSVQFPEPTPEKSPAHKAGFKSIADIGRERLIRAGKQIRDSANGNIFAREVDVGFRYFRWSESPVRKWHAPSGIDKKELLRMTEARRALDAKADPFLLLTGAMLRLCYPLCAGIEEKTVEVPDPVPGDKKRTVSCRMFHVTTPQSPRGFHFCPERTIPIRIGWNLDEKDVLVCREDALDASAAITIARRHRLQVI